MITMYELLKTFRLGGRNTQVVKETGVGWFILVPLAAQRAKKRLRE
jgi:hypothetical protein